ncbi:MAG: hypothetical protein ACI4W6_07695 [Acutalibacteraceae bacterium]
MKTVKKFCSILLAFCVVTLLVACNNTYHTDDNTYHTDNVDNTDNTDEKWVLTYEIEQYSDEYDDPSVINEKFFEYDNSGKIVSEEFICDDNNSFVNSNFVYDENDNLTYKSGIKKSYFGDSSYSYTYTYDTNGNCVSELRDGVTLDGEKYTETLTYKYNEFGDIIEMHSMYQCDTFERETNYISTLTYEDNICIQDETRMEYVEGKEIKTTYTVDKYIYDTNGKKSKKLHYAEIQDMSEAKNPVLINGRYYKLATTTEYTYEVLKDVAITQETNSQISTITSASPASETKEKRLSESCDEILASGYDTDKNYYELVSNETEDYLGLKISVGVIKNNEWILEPTTNMPFVTEENSFSSKGPEIGKVYYIGNGCFLSEKLYRSNSLAVGNYMYIVYNANSKKSYSTADYDWSNKKQIPIPVDSNDKYMIIGYTQYSQYSDFTILNKIEMSTHQVEIEGSVHDFQNISEGLFAVAIGDSNYPNYYFYDSNGNEQLNLSNFKTEGYQNLHFVDGKCLVEIINDNDTIYQLTIDKTGNVIDSIKK